MVMKRKESSVEPGKQATRSEPGASGPAGLRSKVNGAEIPDIVIKRLPIYARSLQYLAHEGVETVSSGDLGARLGASAAQISAAAASAREHALRRALERPVRSVENAGAVERLVRVRRALDVEIEALEFAHAVQQLRVTEVSDQMRVQTEAVRIDQTSGHSSDGSEAEPAALVVTEVVSDWAAIAGAWPVCFVCCAVAGTATAKTKSRTPMSRQLLFIIY